MTRPIREPDVTEFLDLATAINEAQAAARDLLAALLREGAVVDGQIFEIADADDRVLVCMPFRNVLRLS